MSFDVDDVNLPEESNCSICLGIDCDPEELKAFNTKRKENWQMYSALTACGHVFHTICIHEWTSKPTGTSCPMCRKPIHGHTFVKSKTQSYDSTPLLSLIMDVKPQTNDPESKFKRRIRELEANLVASEESKNDLKRKLQEKNSALTETERRVWKLKFELKQSENIKRLKLLEETMKKKENEVVEMQEKIKQLKEKAKKKLEEARTQLNSEVAAKEHLARQVSLMDDQLIALRRKVDRKTKSHTETEANGLQQIHYKIKHLRENFSEKSRSQILSLHDQLSAMEISIYKEKRLIRQILAGGEGEGQAKRSGSSSGGTNKENESFSSKKKAVENPRTSSKGKQRVSESEITILETAGTKSQPFNDTGESGLDYELPEAANQSGECSTSRANSDKAETSRKHPPLMAPSPDISAKYHSLKRTRSPKHFTLEGPRTKSRKIHSTSISSTTLLIPSSDDFEITEGDRPTGRAHIPKTRPAHFLDDSKAPHSDSSVEFMT